jgi:hypothetical protein
VAAVIRVFPRCHTWARGGREGLDSGDLLWIPSSGIQVEVLNRRKRELDNGKTIQIEQQKHYGLGNRSSKQTKNVENKKILVCRASLRVVCPGLPTVFFLTV